MSVVILGSLGKPFAVKGWQALISYTEPPEQIFTYSANLIMSSSANDWRVCRFAETAIRKNTLLVRLVDVDSPEEASHYSLFKVAVQREHLPEVEEGYYWNDLVGMEVLFQSDHKVYNYGRVESVFSAGGKHDVIRVVSSQKTRLIPFIMDRFIIQVDEQAQQIWVAWQPDY